jgi:hypothetical protein
MNLIFEKLHRYPLKLNLTFLDRFKVSKTKFPKINRFTFNKQKLKDLFTVLNYNKAFNFRYNSITKVAKCYYEDLLVFTITEYKELYIIFIGNDIYIIEKDNEFTTKSFRFFQYAILNNIKIIQLKSDYKKIIINGNEDKSFAIKYDEYYGQYNYSNYAVEYEKVLAYFRQYDVEFHEREFGNKCYLALSNSGDSLNNYFYDLNKGKIYIENESSFDYVSDIMIFDLDNGKLIEHKGIFFETILEEIGII